MSRVSMPLAALLAAGLLAACQEEPHAEAPPSRPVLSAVVSSESVRAVGFAGSIEPRYEADLGFRVLGRVISRDVDVGDIVEKGQLLATLDPIAYRLAVRSARADLSRAAAKLENAAAAEIRHQTLLRQKVSTQAQLDAARQARESAEAGVTRARAHLDTAEEQLGYTELRADFEGVVTATGAELGQVVQPGRSVVSVARPDIREAVVDLPESIGREVEPGIRFEVALQLDPSVQVAGSVREVAPQADPATRTRRVRITLENPPESFRLGTTVTATTPTRASEGFELPVTALLEQAGETMVWVVDPATGTVSTRNVTIAERHGPSARILHGLTDGMRVVTAGVHSLTPGQTVEIAEGALQ